MSDNSSRDSSPDPITLPSSPLSGRKLLLRASSSKPRLSTPRLSRASPVKSIVLDTPQAGDGQSPWRIKVTVQAEPRDGSPGKVITRTRSIPLVSPSARRSGSPGKKKLIGNMAEGEVKKPTRKRKGTPIREKRSAPQLRRRQQSQIVPALEPLPGPQSTVEEKDNDIHDDGDAMHVVSQTPPNNRRSSGRMARLTAQWSDGSGRTKRLSTAREELDQALMDAVGGGHDEPGEMTLSRAEDFTMVSMESLQTAKEASMLHNSQLHANPEPHRSALSASYLPSSPPKTRPPPQVLDPDVAASVARSSLPGSGSLQQASEVRTAQTSLQSPFEPVSSAKKRSSARRDYDAMSWQPTGLAKPLRSSTASLEKQTAQVQIPRSETQPELEALSKQARITSLRNAIAVDDMASASEEELDDEDGLWDNEASRSIAEQQGEQRSSAHDRGDSSSDQNIVVHQPDQQDRQMTAERESPVQERRTEQFEDLFSHIPLKPARSKIPRTWRRSSGMDFSYVDSPARPPATEGADEHRHSEAGSGVLTPPSSAAEDDSDNDQGEAGTVDLQDEADDQLQSEFTIPEAEATRLHDYDMLQDEDAHGSDREEASRLVASNHEAEVRIDSKSPVYEHAAGGDSSRVSLKDKPRRRPPRRPTADLADLLNLDGSPAKPPQQTSPNHTQISGSGSLHQATSSSRRYGSSSITNRRLSASHEQQHSSHSPHHILSSGNEMTNIAPTTRPQESEVSRSNDLFRRRMLIGKTATSATGATKVGRDIPTKTTPQAIPEHSTSLLTHDPLTGQPLAQPKRRGRQRRAQQLADNSVTETTATDSFTSKASDQRQLLQEVAASRVADRPSAGIGFRDYALPNSIQPQKHHMHVQTPGQRQQHAEESSLRRGNEDAEECSNDVTDETLDRHPSYQENLNLDSPTKIKVNFNDTISGSSSWLEQPKRYPSLFSQNREQPRTPLKQSFRPIALQRPREHHENVVAEKEETTNGTGFLSRLTTTFWNAVIRPTGPAELMPPPAVPVQYSATLRSQVRSRYGVLRESHPWTMAHMRTLHRMLNSLTSGRYDSIIPRKGALPQELERKIDTIQTSATNHKFIFKLEYAYVVWSFMQILVPPTTIDLMSKGEIEFIGDSTAKRIRGYFDPKRHGDDLVWTAESLKHKDPAIAAWINSQTGLIDASFVSKALGDCVLANEVLRDRLEREGRSHEFERVCFGDIRATPERDDDASLD